MKVEEQEGAGGGTEHEKVQPPELIPPQIPSRYRRGKQQETQEKREGVGQVPKEMDRGFRLHP
jgi:hypothetical protein